MMTDKIALRRSVRGERAAYFESLNGRKRDDLLGALADQVLGRLPAQGVVASYSAYGDEIDPALIAAALNGRLAHPYFSGRDAPMEFRMSEGAFDAGPFGIPQPPASATPVDPDIVLVPMIAGDLHCHRLGQGKGHYDRALAALAARKSCHTIGLAWDVQIVEQVPREAWDVALDAIATPTRWIAPAA